MPLDNPIPGDPAKPVIDDPGESFVPQENIAVSSNRRNDYNFQPPAGFDRSQFQPARPILNIRGPDFSPWEALTEGFKQNNIFAADAANDAFRRSLDYAEANQEGAPIDPFEISVYAGKYPLQYSGLKTRTGVWLTDQRIKEGLYAQQKVRSNGWTATIGAFAGAVTDPFQIFFPFAGLRKGVGFVKGFKQTASPVFAATVVDEMLISDAYPTRTMNESAMIVAMATGITGLLGGTVGSFGRSYSDRVISRYMDDIADYEKAATGRLGGSREPRDGPTFKSAGSGATNEGLAAKTPTEELHGEGLARAAGLEKLQESPYKRNLQSMFLSVREFTVGLIESPGLFQNKNFKLEATELSVETKIRPWQYEMVEAMNNMTHQWGLSRGTRLGSTAAKQTIGLAKMAIKDKLGNRPMGTLSHAEFREEVSHALRSNEPHSNPYVEASAVKIRKLFDKLKDEAVEADLFTAAQRSKLKQGASEVAEMKARQDQNDADILELQTSLKTERIKITQKHGKKVKHNQEKWAAYDKEAARLKAMVSRSFDAKKELASKNKTLRGLEEEIDRIREEGPTVFNDKGYVPRIWRIDKIEANMAEFRQIIGGYLTKRGVAKGDLELAVTEMLERIRRDHNFNQIKEFDPGIARSARERLIDIDDSLLTKFIENDIDIIMRHHVRTFSTDLELVKRFGTIDLFDQIRLIKEEGAEAIVKAAPSEQAALRKKLSNNLRDFTALRDRLRGTYGLPDDPYRPLSRFYRVMKQWNYLTFLGGVVLSALPDLARPIMTEGFMNTMRPTFAALNQNAYIRQMAAKEIHRSGTALDMILNTRAMAIADTGDVFGRQTGIERALHRGAEAFSMINLLNPWNTAVKEWAGTVIAARIFESADLFAKYTGPVKRANHDFVKLARSGIDKPMAKRLMKQFYEHGDIAHRDGSLMRDTLEGLTGKELTAGIDKHIAKSRKEGGVFLPNTDLWADLEATASFRGALSQDVDRAIVTPGAADRPLWMSTELGSVIAQFKGFGVGAAQRVLTSALQEKQAYNIHGLAMMVGMGMIVNQMKQSLSGYDFGEEGLAKSILGGIDRSGVLGYFGDLDNAISALSDGAVGMKASVDDQEISNRGLVGAVFGPTASKLFDIRTVVSDVGNGRYDTGTSGALRRFIPLQNHFALSHGFAEIQKSAPPATQ